MGNYVSDSVHPHITLGDFEKLVKGCLELSNPAERYAVRQEQVKFQITSDTRRAVIEGKYRQSYYEVEEIVIADNALVVRITREFEELEGFPNE
jgi:predicted mannosyl-3-phosphoglycerate phosphatase (HAD superfamily)